ncbi:winged helix-turn-helix domain-containing protein [Methylomonas sp. 11b]|uniref:winged helix-turn-helix domain-containing protein n=1 Tax=Methylomonas sp. 11b TaxID=1168169 RepID=UPI0004B6FA18|nr:winged helix-turn-helix domain-containing protein [Methylomonas sp. 11b]
MKKTTPTSETSVSATEKPAPAKATKKSPTKSVAVKTAQEMSTAPGKTKAKPKATTTPKAVKTATEAPTAPESTEKAPAPTVKAAAKKANPKPKAAKVEPTVEAEPSETAPIVISMHERIGLTAGVIWHHLAENGATPVAKLVYVLPEEEAIIQRSIGWLAQEDKITLSARGGDQVETIVLKG